LIVQNPSSKSFTVRSLIGTLTSNDYQIGNVSSYSSVYIRPNGNTVYRLNVRLNVLGVVNDILNALNGGGISQSMRFKGTANVDGFMVPIFINYKIG
jgi:LEA14-like dessication related protein